MDVLISDEARDFTTILAKGGIWRFESLSGEAYELVMVKPVTLSAGMHLVLSKRWMVECRGPDGRMLFHQEGLLKAQARRELRWLKHHLDELLLQEAL